MSLDISEAVVKDVGKFPTLQVGSQLVFFIENFVWHFKNSRGL